MPFVSNFTVSKFRTGTKTAFAQGLETGRVQSRWSRFAQRIASNTLTEQYPFLDALPNMREWVGERFLKNVKVNNYTLTNKDYESSISVPANAIKDDQYEVFMPMFGAMGQKAMQHTDKICFQALVDGFTDTCYDGLSFFHDAHVVGDTTYDNDGDGSGSPWFLLDTKVGLLPIIYQEREPVSMLAKINPTDENVLMEREFRYFAQKRCAVGYGLWQSAYGSKSTLSAANFDTATETMMGFKDAEGSPLGISPDLLIVGPANRTEALAILEAQVLASGASNTNYKAVELIVSPYIT